MPNSFFSRTRSSHNNNSNNNNNTSSSSKQPSRLKNFMKRRRSSTPAASQPSKQGLWRLNSEDTPGPQDWWQVDETNDDRKTAAMTSTSTTTPSSSTTSNGNSNQTKESAPSSTSKAFSSCLGNSTPSDAGVVITPGDTDQQQQGVAKKFQNVGYKNWQKSRAEWRIRTVENPKKAPPVDEVDEIEIKMGLSQVQRTFELPVTVSLPNIISLYQSVWHGDDD